MEKIVGIGEWWKEFHLHGSFRHELFFRYLQISPSYQLAHRVLKQKSGISKCKYPVDFKEVCKTYSELGNVFDSLFIEWWNSVGRSLPMTGSDRRRLVMSIDPGESLRVLIEQFTKIVKSYQSEKSRNRRIEILTNKIQHRSLRERLCLVMAKAQTVKDENRVENWRLAVECELASSKLKGLEFESKKTQKNVVAREYLSMLVSKNLKEALVISENAARGKFPSLEPIETGLSFDYEQIMEIDRADSNRLVKILATRGRNDFISHLDPSRSRRKIKPKTQ